jgi:selenide,water dikinase
VTTDFFTPVVDDPYDYGAIAAANALSDIYAMGGKPFLALNIAALPPNLPPETSSAILRGGAEKSLEAGAALAGGHSVQDAEPKYGLIALGFLDPSRMLTKDGASEGDALVLTKPLGTGAITTAFIRDLVKPEHLDEAVKWMKRLNKGAAELAVQFGLKGATDITGFSLLGHACEMAAASKVKMRFSFAQLPFLPGAQDYAQEWIFPGGSSDNKLYYGKHVDFSPAIDEASQMLMYDAQTSGGLLLCVPRTKLDYFMAQGSQAGLDLWIVGEVLEGSGIEVT